MKIKCVKIEKCPICGEKGSIQVFFNKQNEIKYARVRNYILKGDKNYNPNKKIQFLLLQTRRVTTVRNFTKIF